MNITPHKLFVCTALAVLAIVAFFDMSAAVAMCPAVAITEEGLEEVVTNFKKATAEVKELGAELVRKAKNGEDASLELKGKVDEALTKQGEINQQILDIQQSVADAIKNIGSATGPDDLGAQLKKAHEEAGLAKIGDAISFRGKTVNMPISRKALVNSGVTGAALNYPGVQVLAQPQQPLVRRLTIRDLLAQGRISKAVLFYMRETGFVNNAAPVSEGSLKPKSELTFDLQTETVKTLAHLFDISLQMLDDVEFIQSYIETRGRYGLALVEENQLLNGSGTGQNLEGIYTAATPYVQPAGVEVQAEQDIDKLRLAMLQVELANAFTTGIVLHPTNWANIELIKDSLGRYIIANPQNTTTGRIWGRDVVSTQAMALGRFLVGDFAAHAQIFDRQDANVAISFENKDNFERNMATLRIEERLALAIYRPEAFVKGVLESAS
ncbi:phage major capsid protein [Dokdonella sp. MW10]|uniref:phage major capsid protein n=1 Tax=Dokdonella sp. MW10 TaxID=2992926 RepID=UPI003F80BBBC